MTMGTTPAKNAWKYMQNINSNKNVWEALKSHVDRGDQAIDLLHAIFLEMDPYQHGKITDQTWTKVQLFFDFDDSE